LAKGTRSTGQRGRRSATSGGPKRRRSKSIPSTDKAASETAKRISASRRTSGVAKRTAAKQLPEFQPPPNDNLSSAFDRLGLVPERYRGTDKFIDIVTWNIRFFHDQDRDRVRRIVGVLSELNADIIVLQEIRNQSMEVVAEELRRLEAGFYSTAYGTTGGDQRVALLYDLDWVRAKEDVTELFGKGQIMTNDGKDAFPRLPLYSAFTCLTEERPFDFQLVGVHLKSQRGGGEDQRTRAARELRSWLVDEAPRYDADVIILGDWNAPPSADAWSVFHDLEDEGQVKFRSVNNESEISHLMYRNKHNFGSRLDLTALSMSASERMGEPPDVVRWAPLDELLGTDPKASQIKEFLKALREEVSDHLPVVTRFYFSDDRDG
jgi:endonuclease/exonuclease/phosphatase family metal-dependent hydrolase